MKWALGVVAAFIFVLSAGTAQAAPDYRAKLRSAHPRAVQPGYTYRGDTVVASFRDLNLATGKTRRYRVCYRHNRKSVCVRKTLTGSAWSRWHVYVGAKWSGWVNGTYVGYIPFSWRVAGVLVAKRRIRVYGD
jgi:hypothetical protein